MSSSLLDTVIEREDEVEEEPAKEEITEDKQGEGKKSDVASRDPSDTKLTNVTSSVTDVMTVSESQGQSQVVVEPVASSQLLVVAEKQDDEDLSAVEQPSEAPISPLKLGKV